MIFWLVLFFFKQKTAYEMRISDWSSDVCSSDLGRSADLTAAPFPEGFAQFGLQNLAGGVAWQRIDREDRARRLVPREPLLAPFDQRGRVDRAAGLGHHKRRHRLPPRIVEIGRSPCRERGCQSV